MVNLVKKFLEINQYYKAKAAFETTYLSHPNYPSLFAVTDSLTMLAVENIAVKISKEQYEELPNSFLTIIKNAFVLLQKNKDKVIITPMEGKKYSYTVEEFMLQWDPTVIAIEPNLEQKSINLNNKKWLSYLLPFGLWSIWILFAHSFEFTHFLFFVLSSIGFGLGVLVIQEKLGFSNPVTSKICEMSGTNSCNSVWTATESKINDWINFSDLPIIFFGANLLLLSFLGNSATSIITFNSILSIPVILYSFWLQKMVVQKWCTLCLLIASVILLHVVFGSYTSFTTSSILLSITYYLFTFVIVGLVWKLWDKTLQRNTSLTEQNHRLKRFYRNFAVFQSLCKSIPNLSNFENLSRIPFGRKNAPVQLTLLLSPSCGHCHTAFQDAFALQKTFSEQLYLEVIWNINPQNIDNPYKVIAENIVSMLYYDVEQAKEALIDWHMQQLTLDQWKQKWVLSDINFNVSVELQKQYDWCRNNQFNYTPVILVNEQLYPSDYELSDLKYFIETMSEVKTIADVSA